VTSKTSQLVARTKKELNKLKAEKDARLSGLQNITTELAAPIQDSEFIPTKPVDQRYADAMKLLGPKNKGQKSSISMDYPQFLSGEESLDLARNADLASQVMGLGAFENSVGAENSREIIKSFKDRLKSLEENYADPTLAYGAGAILTKNPLLTSLAGQKYQSADEKVLSTQEKFANALTKISDMYNKTDADKIDLYKAQKLPPGNLKLAQDTDLPRLPSSRSGQDRMIEKDIFKDYGKLNTEIENAAAKFDSMEDAFNSKKYNQIVSNLGPFARLISDEKGVLTEQDITRNLPPNIFGTFAKMEAYFSKAPEGNVPEEYATGLRKLIQRAREKNYGKYTSLADSLDSQYKASPSYGKFMQEGSSGWAASNNVRKAAEKLNVVKSGAGLSAEEKARKQEILKKLGRSQ